MVTAAVQMVSKADVSENMKAAGRLVGQAASEGAQLVLLPENFAVFNASALYEWGEKEREGFLSEQVASWAREYQVWIVAGTLPERTRFPESGDVSPGRVRTSSLVFNPRGERQARYDKIHLFDVDVADAHGAYRESETIEPGSEGVLLKVPLNDGQQIGIGLTVCYDLRFPELYRMLAAQGADIFTVPAAFTWETGRAHWESLLRARAIENQCYVIAANQGGDHSSTRKTWGHSMIIDPWGRVVASLEEGEGVVTATLDFSAQASLRKQMPVQQHRVIL
ncbi:MAG: carbon-nitrogen hydrolase family protein [Ketobacteraceae bacterium]|nr:carbon-nitrogen hydrolase family protein [Ketobacteraceae bacterium]